MRRYAAVFILVLSAIALVAGITRLFELRFESGDVYPLYSTLRSDPLGTMVFYESLERLPELSVRRDYSTLNQLPDGSGTAYLHLAASMDAWKHITAKDFAEIDRFVNNGGRLVIAMRPTPAEIVRPSLEEKQKQKNPEEDSLLKTISVVDHWGLDASIVNLDVDPDSGYKPALAHNVSGLTLPETLAWHSGIVFSDLKAAWKPIFLRDKFPVVVERQFGRGSVVFASDTYFLSNEAMRKDRHADFLAWLVGPDRAVVFDEAHLGVTESANIATLMGRYHLRWLLASLALLAGLFIWKNATSLVPISQDERQPVYISGKEAGEGFVNLLRRTIPARDILSVCFREWKSSVSHAEKHGARRRKQAESAFEAENSGSGKDHDPVRTYQTISRLLQKRTL